MMQVNFIGEKQKHLSSNNHCFQSAASPYILPRHLVQDIDTKEDWKRAELMFQVLKHSGELV